MPCTAPCMDRTGQVSTGTSGSSELTPSSLWGTAEDTVTQPQGLLQRPATAVGAVNDWHLATWVRMHVAGDPAAQPGVQAVWPTTHCTRCHAVIALAVAWHTEQEAETVWPVWPRQGATCPGHASSAQGATCCSVSSLLCSPLCSLQCGTTASPAGMRQQPLADIQPDMSALLFCKGRQSCSQGQSRLIPWPLRQTLCPAGPQLRPGQPLHQLGCVLG